MKKFKDPGNNWFLWLSKEAWPSNSKISSSFPGFNKTNLKLQPESGDTTGTIPLKRKKWAGNSEIKLNFPLGDDQNPRAEPLPVIAILEEKFGNISLILLSVY